MCELAVSSASELTVDPEVSLVLAVRAVGVARTQEAEYALTQALLASRERAVLSSISGSVSVDRRTAPDLPAPLIRGPHVASNPHRLTRSTDCSMI